MFIWYCVTPSHTYEHFEFSGNFVSPWPVPALKEFLLFLGRPPTARPISICVKILWDILFRLISKRYVCYVSFYSGIRFLNVKNVISFPIVIESNYIKWAQVTEQMKEVNNYVSI
jgi:hypothetical protein